MTLGKTPRSVKMNIKKLIVCMNQEPAQKNDYHLFGRGLCCSQSHAGKPGCGVDYWKCAFVCVGVLIELWGRRSLGSFKGFVRKFGHL